jgi:hypothetical protein
MLLLVSLNSILEKFKQHKKNWGEESTREGSLV